MLENTIEDFDKLTAAWQKVTSKLGAMWCGFMHDSPMWPIHGHYECRTCGRHYPVQWVRDGFRSALLPLILMLAILLPSRGHAAERAMVDSTDRAAMAFARYTAGLAQTGLWNMEAIEIDASLPRIKKEGRLRAIRRLLPLGKPEYQVLELTGDKTVRQQVIVRYLSAETVAAAMPASAVAISPANYKFSYKRAVTTADGVAYAFVITPRKKKDGLIKGELWLDGETGAVVRQSGYLVRNPSVFVKRINVTRETAIRNGLAEERTTHLSVDTRLAGRAELTIHERPYTELDSGFVAGIAQQ